MIIRVHCDEARICVPIPNDLKRAATQVIYREGWKAPASVGKFGFPQTVGYATVYCRPCYVDRHGTARYLVLDGNPSKIPSRWGMWDTVGAPGAFRRLIRKTCHTLELPADVVGAVVAAASGSVSRIHLTGHFQVGHTKEALAALLREAADRGFTHSSEGGGETIYIGKANGKESRNWVVVVYDKYLELLKNRPTGISDDEYNRLLLRAKGVLRVEIRVNRDGLRAMNLRQIESWDQRNGEEVYFSVLDQCDFTATAKPILTLREQEELTPAEKGDYMLWLKGIDLRGHLPARTFQRRAKKLAGLDVDLRGRRRPRHDEDVDLSTLFRPQNLLPPSHWQDVK